MLERDLEAVFNREVRTAGGISIKMNAIVAGTPDRLVLWPGGRSCLVELKTETGTVSKVQALWHSRAAAIGHPVFVLHGRAEVMEWIAAQALI